MTCVSSGSTRASGEGRSRRCREGGRPQDRCAGGAGFRRARQRRRHPRAPHRTGNARGAVRQHGSAVFYRLESQADGERFSVVGAGHQSSRCLRPTRSQPIDEATSRPARGDATESLAAGVDNISQALVSLCFCPRGSIATTTCLSVTAQVRGKQLPSVRRRRGRGAYISTTKPRPTTLATPSPIAARTRRMRSVSMHRRARAVPRMGQMTLRTELRAQYTSSQSSTGGTEQPRPFECP